MTVVIGFTNGIAVLIALSQVRDLLGLDIVKMPASFFGQIGAITSHIHSLNPFALGLGGLCVLGLVLAVVLFVRRQSEIFRAEPVARTEQQATYKLYGSLFFGAVTKIDPIVADVERSPNPINVMLDASHMISLDTTGLDALEQLHKAVHKRGGHLGMVGLLPQPRSLIERSGFAARLNTFE